MESRWVRPRELCYDVSRIPPGFRAGLRTWLQYSPMLTCRIWGSDRSSTTSLFARNSPKSGTPIPSSALPPNARGRGRGHPTAWAANPHWDRVPAHVRTTVLHPPLPVHRAHRHPTEGTPSITAPLSVPGQSDPRAKTPGQPSAGHWHGGDRSTPPAAHALRFAVHRTPLFAGLRLHLPQGVRDEGARHPALQPWQGVGCGRGGRLAGSADLCSRNSTRRNTPGGRFVGRLGVLTTTSVPPPRCWAIAISCICHSFCGKQSKSSDLHCEWPQARYKDPFGN